MDGDLVLIFAFILTIIVIVTLGVNMIVRRTFDHKERMANRNSSSGASKDDFRKLEERIRVLERIATDNNQDLALQIEQLRDVQQFDDLTNNKERIS